MSGEHGTRAQLIRLALGPDGSVAPDIFAKAPGRGAWIGVTSEELTKAQAKRLAMIAQTGMARAIYPVHAPLDGDVVFAAATGTKPVDPPFGLTALGMVAANTVARAIARGVHSATALPFLGALPAWGDRFG